MLKRDQVFGAWSGVALAALFGVGLIIAGFIPPVPAHLPPEQVVELYQSNSSNIRLGMIIGLFGVIFIFPFSATITMQMLRIEGASKMPAYLQLAAGAANSMVLSLPMMIFAIATFRPERNADTTLLLHDVGWLLLICLFPIQFAQNLAITMGVLGDKSSKPVFPRWIGYLNAWFCVLLVPVVLAFYFRTGPFAWHGLVSFWIAATAFFIWITCMVFTLNKAIKDDPS